jgi:acyl carrier protein
MAAGAPRVFERSGRARSGTPPLHPASAVSTVKRGAAKKKTRRRWLRRALLGISSVRGDMEAAEVRQHLKELMVSELNLEGKSPADIDDAASLFGDGLGLDSLDALQLAMSIEERFGVKIPEGPEARPIFASVDALVEHIVATSGAG